MDIFDYRSAVKERIACNACGNDDCSILARTSRGGAPVETCLCRRCGLIYINPRMTAPEYDRYYREFYRDDRSAIKNDSTDDSPENLFVTSRRYGAGLARKFRTYFSPGLTIDVGSGVGGVLSGIRDEVPGIDPFGIEPSASDTAYAQARGIPCETTLFEEYEDRSGQQAVTILCTKSLNHLLDPRKFFAWAFAHLTPGGHLILAVKNFRHQCRRAGSVAAGVQIDHVFMFTPEVLQPFVESVGFKVVHAESDEYKSESARHAQRQEGLSVGHVWIVAERPSPAAGPGGVMREQRHVYRRLRFQFLPPLLALYYYIFHSARLARVRRLCARLVAR